MSNKLILALIVGVVVIAGGVWFIGYGFSGGSSPELEPSDSTEERQSTAGSRRITGSIDDLLAEGESYRCTFTYESDLADSTGVVYVTDGKLKGDFQTEVAALGGQVVTHLIRDGESVYTWIDGTSVGVKAPANISGSGSARQSTFDPLEQQLNYDCEPWEVDPGVFILPAGVQFSEVAI